MLTGYSKGWWPIGGQEVDGSSGQREECWEKEAEVGDSGVDMEGTDRYHTGTDNGASQVNGCRLDGLVKLDELVKWMPNKRPKCELHRRVHVSIYSADGSEKVQVQETPSI